MLPKPYRLKNSKNERSNKKTLHGPLAIYPGHFFLEAWDQTWIDLLKLEPQLLKEDKREILEKSPLSYLAPCEKQALILFNIHDLLTHLFHYRKNRWNSNQEDELKSLKKKMKVCWDLFDQVERSTPELKEEDFSFFQEIITSFLLFTSALIEEGHKSRKIMAIAHAHYNQAKSILTKRKEEKNDHPYLDYYEALLLIGRDRWEEATALLHRTLKKHQENNQLAKLLCRLYLHAGLPHVAYFIRGKYLSSSLEEESKRNHSWKKLAA